MLYAVVSGITVSMPGTRLFPGLHIRERTAGPETGGPAEAFMLLQDLQIANSCDFAVSKDNGESKGKV